jgi:hypothetical protein
MKMLLCCARRVVSPEIAQQIRAFAAGPLDWEKLLSQSTQHSLTSLLEHSLRTAVPEQIIPEARWEHLRKQTRGNALHALALGSELARVVRRLDEQGIRVLSYKGPVLAIQAYHDVALRQFDDLDIVLRQRDMGDAHETLLGLGYTAKFAPVLSPAQKNSPIPGEYKYYNETRRVLVELHTEKTLRHFPVEPNLDELFERSVSIEMGGSPVNTFAPEDALIAICVHGSKDFWDRILWITDVSELIQAHPRLDWDAVVSRAESLKAQRMLNLGLLLASELLDTRLPDPIAGRAHKDEAASTLAFELRKNLLATDPSPFGVARRFGIRRRSVRGWLFGWGYAGRLTMLPSDEDWRDVRLPRTLAPLYLLLRPLRLLQKYGRFGRSASAAAK